MMQKKASIGIASAVAIITAIGGLAGASEDGFLNLDFSTVNTNIDSHDIITTIINDALDVDLDEFRVMCDNGEVDDEFEKYCDIVN